MVVMFYLPRIVETVLHEKGKKRSTDALINILGIAAAQNITDSKALLELSSDNAFKREVTQIVAEYIGLTPWTVRYRTLTW